MLEASAPVPAPDLRSHCEAIRDWAAFGDLLRRHRVEALVGCRLLALPEDALPSPIRAQLEAARRTATARSLRLATELLRLLGAFAEADIRVIPIKGTSLALGAYGALGLRQAGDIDLLISPSDLVRADRLVVDLGYQRIVPASELVDPLRSAILASRHDVEYWHPVRRVRMELHWRWLRNPHWLPLDFDALHAGVGWLDWHGQRLPLVPPEELFIYLCAHGTHHRWARWSWLNDLRFMAASTRYAPNCARLRELACRGNAEPAVSMSLALLAEVTGEPPWCAARGRERTHHPPSAWAQVLAAPADSATHIKPWQEILDEWRLLKSWRGRIVGVLWQRVLAPSENDVETLPLPHRGFWLYPLLRPWLWLWRRVRRMRRHA